MTSPPKQSLPTSPQSRSAELTAEAQSPSLSWLDDELAQLDADGLRRAVATRFGPQGAMIRIQFPGDPPGGRELINFGSNDYLGLAADPRLAAAAQKAAAEEGWGAGASPLVSGHSQSHELLNRRLAEFLGTEAALVFPSGFAANTGTICALVGRGDVAFADEKNHASLIDGCRLSRAEVLIYPHCDMSALTAQLADSSTKKFRRRLIVTDTLFSMDGDLAPLGDLVELAERHRCMLMVDEAHATGVFGANGRGVAEHFGVEQQIPIRMGTLSKALGSAGGFVAGSRQLIDWLWNRARPFVFSTAHPPAIAAAAIAALGIVASEPHRRIELLSRAAELREILATRCGFPSAACAAAQIIPLVIGPADKCVAAAATLRRAGLFVPAIRPPSVLEGQSLLRVSLSFGHTAEMFDRLSGSLLSPEGVRFA
jgi:8-amino-7-oxononanoate synthase